MPVTRVKTRWVSGNLEFRDGAGNIIATWDGVNRRLDIPAGSALRVAGTPVTDATLVMGKWTVTGYGANGAITIAPGIANLTKAGVAAMTITDPAAGDAGTLILITSQTAQAHTVSNTGGSGFNGAGAGSIKATFGGAIGDNFIICAINTKWHVISAKNVTLGAA